MQITYLMNQIMKGKCYMSAQLESPFLFLFVCMVFFTLGLFSLFGLRFTLENSLSISKVVAMRANFLPSSLPVVYPQTNVQSVNK